MKSGREKYHMGVRRITFIHALATVVCLCCVCPAFSQYKEAPIDIMPSIRKHPIAIPIFRSPGEYAGVAREAADITAETLEFTGYFKLLDRITYLQDPRVSGITEADIDLKTWSHIGADFLITGGLGIQGKTMRLEMWAYQPVKGRKLTAKEYAIYYSGQWRDDLRKAIRKFCNQFIYEFTGSYGIFESKIAFVSTASGNKEIYTCDFDGGNIERFTRNRSINLTPDWSSDGKWLAYTSYKRGNPDIFIQKYKDSHGRSVSKKGLNTTPSWAPGRFQMAATLSFNGDQEIYMLTGKGKIIKRLTRNWGIDMDPTWSPDGKKIAFVSNRGGTPQIYIKNLATERLERLTFEGRYNTQPSWSPKGDKIVFSAMVKNRTDIRVINMDGGGLVQLTNSGRDESPSWSPDGSMIVFSSSREGPDRIYVMTSIGTDQKRLLSMKGKQGSPKWSPSVVDDK